MTSFNYTVKSIKPSLTHDYDVTVTYTDGGFSTDCTFSINKIDFTGSIEEQIAFMLEQPTLHGKVKEVMIRDVEKLKREASFLSQQ